MALSIGGIQAGADLISIYGNGLSSLSVDMTRYSIGDLFRTSPGRVKSSAALYKPVGALSGF